LFFSLAIYLASLINDYLCLLFFARLTVLIAWATARFCPLPSALSFLIFLDMRFLPGFDLWIGILVHSHPVPVFLGNDYVMKVMMDN